MEKLCMLICFDTESKNKSIKLYYISMLFYSKFIFSFILYVSRFSVPSPKKLDVLNLYKFLYIQSFCCDDNSIYFSCNSFLKSLLPGNATIQDKVKAWTQHTLDTGNYFGKKATSHDYEICKQSLEYYNDTEIYRKEVHEQFPALYPDDIENISNMSEEQSYLCCQIQATLLQRMRSSTPIDTSCWCTCPKKESQN